MGIKKNRKVVYILFKYKLNKLRKGDFAETDTKLVAPDCHPFDVNNIEALRHTNCQPIDFIGVQTIWSFQRSSKVIRVGITNGLSVSYPFPPGLSLGSHLKIHAKALTIIGKVFNK